MKLSQIKNEDALEVLAEIMEPVAEIVKDKKFEQLMKDPNTPNIDRVKYILKVHKTSIVKIIAAMHQVPVEEYEFNIISLTKDVLEMMDDDDLLGLFTSQSQEAYATNSGSATENIEESDQK